MAQSSRDWIIKIVGIVVTLTLVGGGIVFAYGQDTATLSTKIETLERVMGDKVGRARFDDVVKRLDRIDDNILEILKRLK